MLAKWTIKTDLQLNLAGEYKFHYEMVPIVGDPGGLHGTHGNHGALLSGAVKLVGFIVDAGLMHGLIPGEEHVEGRRLGVDVPVLYREVGWAVASELVTVMNMKTWGLLDQLQESLVCV